MESFLGDAGIFARKFRTLAVSRAALAICLAVMALPTSYVSAEAKTHARWAVQTPRADVSQPLWTARPKGAVIIVVSISDQRLWLYDDGVQVATTTVSTGVPGHLTPRGIFSIIQKDLHHASNIYSNAPMPFMQRITWSGVALHEGHVTGRQASHGCIRMPAAFAARLWPYTRMGMRVIVADHEVRPFEFSHPNLFAAAKKPTTASLSPARPLKFAQVNNGQASDATSVAPATRDAIEASAIELGVAVEVSDAADAKGQPTEGKRTTAADAAMSIVPPPEVAAAPVISATPPVETMAHSVEPPAIVVETPPAEAPPAVATLPPMEAKPEAPESVVPSAINIPPGPGHVAIYVSKKEGKLFVRRNFAPIFDTPVIIRDPARPIGAHVFTAMDIKNDGADVRWTAIDVPDAPPPPAPRRLRKGETPVPTQVVPLVASSAAEALERIEIPDEARTAIAALIQPGASLVISDQGLGRETTVKGTDFIVLTR